MNEDDLTLGESISRSLAILAVAVVIIGLLLVGLAATAGLYAHRQSGVAADTKDALCALRADLEARTQAGEQFLEEHPDGIRGISAESIQQSLDNQQRTIDTLSTLDCP